VKKFIDVLIDIKLMECEARLKEVSQRINFLVTNIPMMKVGHELTISYENEYVELIKERHKLDLAIGKLSRVFNRRTIEIMVNDPELNKE
jgi:hypothetical protein